MKEGDSNKYEKVWKRRIRWCESIDQTFRERKWKIINILIGFREWDREAWSGVNGLWYADTKCKQKKSEREKLNSDRLEKKKEKKSFW
jgi:hypothetical protein